MKLSNAATIRLIAVFKLIKAALLIIVAFGALKMLHADPGDKVQQWVEAI